MLYTNHPMSQPQRDKALQFIEDNLPHYAEVLHTLALGLTEPQVTERIYQPSGLLKDKSGNKKFPSIPDQEMVLTSETHLSLPPDRSAAEYLIDRILGKPKTQALPGDATQPIAPPTQFTPTIGQFSITPTPEEPLNDV